MQRAKVKTISFVFRKYKFCLGRSGQPQDPSSRFREVCTSPAFPIGRCARVWPSLSPAAWEDSDQRQLCYATSAFDRVATNDARSQRPTKSRLRTLSPLSFGTSRRKRPFRTAVCKWRLFTRSGLPPSTRTDIGSEKKKKETNLLFFFANRLSHKKKCKWDLLSLVIESCSKEIAFGALIL